MLPQQNRIFDDLYEVERNKRKAAESGTQDLMDLLRVIAMRMDGLHYEQMCKEDPTIPARWSIFDWKKYFLSIQPPASNSGNDWGGHTRNSKPADNFAEENIHLRAAKAKLQEQLDEAQVELMKIKNAPTRNAKKHKLTAVPAANTPPGDQGIPKSTVKNDEALPITTTDPALAAQALKEPSSYAGILMDFQKFLLHPVQPPEEYALLSSDGRSWQRYTGIIYLLGKWGITSKIEIDALVAQANGISSGSGSIRNTLERLAEYKYLHTQVLVMDKIGVALRFYRLTEEGRALYKAITREDAAESEWTRLDKHTTSDSSEENTCACLAFAMHARRRGWGFRVLTGEGILFTANMQVKRDQENFNVRLVLKPLSSGDAAGLHVLAEENGGRVAFCTATEEMRKDLVQFCRQQNLPGLATDLASLMAPGYTKLNLTDELWKESW